MENIIDKKRENTVRKYRVVPDMLLSDVLGVNIRTVQTYYRGNKNVPSRYRSIFKLYYRCQDYADMYICESDPVIKKHLFSTFKYYVECLLEALSIVSMYKDRISFGYVFDVLKVCIKRYESEGGKLVFIDKDELFEED